MNRKRSAGLCIVASVAGFMAACGTGGRTGPGDTASAGHRPAAIPPATPRLEFRKLHAQLPGKSIQEVARIMGLPSNVHVSGSSESWDYLDAAWDPVSRRPVRRITVWFKNGVVDELYAAW
jgi:hypothetical protein